MPVNNRNYKVNIKKGFEERYKSLLKEDYDKFIYYSLKYLRRSIRVNTLKISVEKLKRRLEKDWILEQIPWCKEGFWIQHKNERRDIGNLIEHQLGYIYVQEAASMIPAIVLDPKPEEIVLDMAAAPGSKTTHIASLMKNQGIIIANDYKHERLVMLGMNLQRCGVTNTIITLMDARKMRNINILFDKILLDAPCSATGAIRKSYKALEMWNPKGIIALSRLQKQMISVAIELLKPNGILVYSTCSLEPEENEEVIDFALNHYNLKVEEIDLNIKRAQPVLEFNNKRYNPEIKKCLRIYPQDNDTEGFFVAKLRKIS